MEELNSLHLKNITKEKTAESFSNTFDKKNQDAAIEGFRDTNW